MITAKQAKTNVNVYRISVLVPIRESVANYCENIISPEIELHSKNGVRFLEFQPYDDSRYFTCLMDRVNAKPFFDEILKSNGYEIKENDYNKNILKIQW